MLFTTEKKVSVKLGGSYTTQIQRKVYEVSDESVKVFAEWCKDTKINITEYEYVLMPVHQQVCIYTKGSRADVKIISACYKNATYNMDWQWRGIDY